MDEKKRDDFSRFQALDDGLVKFFRFFANLSAIALCVIMFLAFVDVVGVKLHAAGVMWATGIPNNNGMIQYFHIPLVFLAAGYVTMDQGHTRIDLLCGKFPQWLEKRFIILGHLLGASLSFYIAYAAVSNILLKQITTHVHITTSASSWPAWPFTVCHIVGFTLLGLSFCWNIVRMIRFWKYHGMNAYYVMHPEKAMGPGGSADDEVAPGETPAKGDDTP